METIKRFPKHTQSISKALPKHYQTTPKQGRIARKEVCLIFEHGNTNKRAEWNKRAGDFFLKIDKRADQNKTVQGGFFSQN